MNKKLSEAQRARRARESRHTNTEPSRILYEPDKATLLLLKQTSEKLTALFAKVHNLQVQIEQMRTENYRLAMQYGQLLHDPEYYKEAIRLDAINRSQGR